METLPKLTIDTHEESIRLVKTGLKRLMIGVLLSGFLGIGSFVLITYHLFWKENAASAERTQPPSASAPQTPETPPPLAREATTPLATHYYEAVLLLSCPNSGGSGFFIAENLVLTAYQNIQNCIESNQRVVDLRWDRNRFPSRLSIQGDVVFPTNEPDPPLFAIVRIDPVKDVVPLSPKSVSSLQGATNLKVLGINTATAQSREQSIQISSQKQSGLHSVTSNLPHSLLGSAVFENNNLIGMITQTSFDLQLRLLSFNTVVLETIETFQ